MSLVQSRCRLDLVQHHSPIWFGRETSNKFSVIKLQKNVFRSPLMPAEKLQVAVDPLCSAALTHDSHRVCGQCMAPERIWKWGGGTRPAPSTGIFLGRAPSLFWPKSTISRFWWALSWWSVGPTVWPLSFCCSWCPVRYGVGATVCGYSVGGSDKSLALTALTRLFCSALPHTSVFCFNPLPPAIFWKLINLKTGPGAGGGAVALICPPPVTTLMQPWYYYRCILTISRNASFAHMRCTDDLRYDDNWMHAAELCIWQCSVTNVSCSDIKLYAAIQLQSVNSYHFEHDITHSFCY